MNKKIRYLTLDTTEIGVLESLLSNPVIGLSEKNRVAFRDYLVDSAHYNESGDICRTEFSTFNFSKSE
jgi:hypothetical protein